MVPWGFQPNPRGQAEQLGRQLGISFSSTQNLVDQLRNVPIQRLVDAQRGWTELTVPRGFSAMDWVPCVEAANVPEVRFLTADPATLMRSGNFLQIPAIIGYTSVRREFGKTINHVTFRMILISGRKFVHDPRVIDRRYRHEPVHR